MRIWKSPRPWAAIACLLACGCSVAREIPRGEYAARPEREDVVVKTKAGAQYRFERVRVRADSLFGDERLDVEGSFDEYRTTALALDDVAALSVRRVDWTRMGLVAGVASAVVLAAVLSQQHDNNTTTGGTGPCGARPCP
ncbi:MAG: hypothetical protein E6K80_13925 [Candidatus Eisenbacteria bacterium]|uniref:Lipoprotein n=1 Tax=Eiseniibacteriota bacterium TaxID=2212470 RepID=A0A538TYK8_UNCEI|nr:MAG: hypothetical protein E6K80_13925 [Candidatus Eisenbacteria bacterium]